MTKQIRQKIQALIIDMDGVLWRSNQPIGDLAATFAEIHDRNLAVVLATNNSTLTPLQYLQRLKSFQINGLEEWQIITSSEATAQYLHQQYSDGGAIFIVGEEGVEQALLNQGFSLGDKDVKAVVVGMDRKLSFQKLRQATLLIRNGALFIGTNPDRTFPTPEGLIPGAGAILAFLEAATYQEPLVMGKPSPWMYQVALARLKLEAGDALVIGDRLETDIAGAQEIGCQTGLVLSGVSSEADAYAWHPPVDYIAADLSSLLRMIP